jgi:CheY-like chemotaxis protein
MRGLPGSMSVEATKCQDACVLLLEDDALISLDAEEMLLGLGARSVLVAHSVEAAEAMVDGAGVDVAVLDLRIGAGRSDGLALALMARGIPFIFTSGYLETDLSEALRRVPVVGKPYASDALRAAFAALR